MKVIEGSKAVAEAVALCEPNVIAAYPITPQTHITEHLSSLVADGELKAEYVMVESEHSAASVVLGASATGARTYTATSSQGLLLMLEVLYNAAGMRLPIVLTCVNRAVSAPLNIWNDHQDSIALRDSGIIQLYAEDNQDCIDIHLQAYKIAEDNRVLLPVMVCMDGYLLSHTSEPVELFEKEQVKRFLPDFRPPYYLTPKNPLTFGSFTEPDKYMETRYIMNEVIKGGKKIIVEVANEFKKEFERFSGDLVESYMLDDAEDVLVGMGSIISTMKVVVDEMRTEGKKIGVLKVRTYRPFPEEEIKNALSGKKNVIIVEKAISLGNGGILSSEIKSAFYEVKNAPTVSDFIAGLGGRDISIETIKNAILIAKERPVKSEFLDLNMDLIGGQNE